MVFDYEKYYRENRHGLGEPAKKFVAFFDAYDRKGAKVLDVGCGQGRAALFLAASYAASNLARLSAIHFSISSLPWLGSFITSA